MVAVPRRAAEPQLGEERTGQFEQDEHAGDGERRADREVDEDERTQKTWAIAMLTAYASAVLRRARIVLAARSQSAIVATRMMT